MSIRYTPRYFSPADDTAPLYAAYQAVQEQKRQGTLGFSKLPYAADSAAHIKAIAADVAADCEDLVVIGIGGSDLGIRAAYRALAHQYSNLDSGLRSRAPRLFFVGDTTDPLPLYELLQVINLERTTLVMVSKSGNTIEQMASFIFLRDAMLQKLDPDHVRKHIVTVTDAATGTLREITNEEGYQNLAIPGDVGGRFTVLSSVGLFVLAVVGIDIGAMLKGAADLDATEGAEPSAPAQFAFHQFCAFNHGRPITVMFPYVYALREFGFWFRQLWAESLGKAVNRQGETVHTGPTPIAAVGPTDQHSQVQLYMEGPQDKIITFLGADETAHDLVLPEAFPHKEGAIYLKGLSLWNILHAEMAATAEALDQAGRPSVELMIERLDAYHLGQLFYFFELATAYAGELWNVNAYDQPGVELGKQLMYKRLGRAGY